MLLGYEPGQLDLGLDPWFLEGVAQVAAHRMRGNVQALGYLAVGEPVGHQPDHRELGLGQRRPAMGRAAFGGRARRLVPRSRSSWRILTMSAGARQAAYPARAGLDPARLGVLGRCHVMRELSHGPSIPAGSRCRYPQHDCTAADGHLQSAVRLLIPGQGASLVQG